MCQIAQRRRGLEKRREGTVILALKQCRDNERPLYGISQWGVTPDLSVLVGPVVNQESGLRGH